MGNLKETTGNAFQDAIDYQEYATALTRVGLTPLKRVDWDKIGKIKADEDPAYIAIKKSKFSYANPKLVSSETKFDSEDYQKFLLYREAGGTLDKVAWDNAGKPTAKSVEDEYVNRIVPPVTPGAPPEVPNPSDYGGGTGGGQSATRKNVVSENGWDFQVFYDGNGNETGRTALGQTPTSETNKTTPYQSGQPIYEGGPLAGRVNTMPDGSTVYYDLYGSPTIMSKPSTTSPYEQWQMDTANRNAGRDENQTQLDNAWLYQQANTQNAQWQQQFDWQKQQAKDAADTGQRNYLAGLAAKPVSWLEYAMASKTIPKVQPWMLPLAPQDYQMGEGGGLPGWNTQGAIQPLTELTRPSGNYMNRLSPSAVQQYYGYEQMRTGATPEDTEYRIRSTTGAQEGSNWLKWSQ
jgi:hypothetical protein